MFRNPMLAAGLAVFVFAGCGKESAPPSEATQAEPSASTGSDASNWTIVDEASLNETQIAQRDRALKARDALMAKLKERLTEVVSKEGLAAAISVCKEDAPRLAKEVSDENKLAIGRTSHRLRNTQNQPPDWAEKLVAEKAGEPTYLAKEDRLAALLPIPTGALCLNCHGTKDGIQPAVLAALQEQYPEDQATGFEEGDLRGWFWVEVAGE